MNKANARRALVKALECLDDDDTINAHEYAASALANLFDGPGGHLDAQGNGIGFRLGGVLLTATEHLVDEVKAGTLGDGESPPLFDEYSGDGTEFYRHGDDDAGDLAETARQARRLK